MAAQILGREGKVEKRKKMEKNESDEEVEKKLKVMVEENGDRSMEEESVEEELEVIVTGSWPRQLVVRVEDGEDGMRSVSYIRLFRSLEENVQGVAKVTRRGDRAVMVEVVSREASLRLQGLKSLCGCAVSVTPHGLLQQRKGVISSWDLLMDSEEDILGELRSVGVREVKRLKKRTGGETGPSPTLLLTFAGDLPEKVRVGCLSIRVRPYVQDPLRCYKCLRFGHTQARCFRGRAVCSRCGEEGHLGKSCKQAPRCTNCGGEHSAFSGACPVVVRERSTQKIMAKEKKSFADAARSFVGGPQPANVPSASGDASRRSALVTAGPRRQPLGKSGSTGTQTVRVRSVETQTESMEDCGAGTQVNPELASTEVQTDIRLHCMWWPHLQKLAHHMVEYVDVGVGEWRFLESEFDVMRSSGKPMSWFSDGEEEESEEESREEGDERMMETGACDTPQNGGCWSPIRPP